MENLMNHLNQKNLREKNHLTQRNMKRWQTQRREKAREEREEGYKSIILVNV